MKTNLDFNTEIPHHEDESAVLKVFITTYSDGPIMNISTSIPHNVSLNRRELESLLEIMDRYEKAQAVLGGAV